MRATAQNSNRVDHDDQRLPEFSLSPAMTFHGAWSEKDVFEVDENIDHDNDNEESGDT